MSIQTIIAAQRVKFCTTISYFGTAYPASVLSIGSDDPDFLPTTGGNALAVDERVFSVNPSDFGTRPVAGDVLVWDSANYIVLEVRAIVYQGSPIVWRIIAYRQTAQKPTANDAAQAAKWTLAP
jgi:hypothetical protein